MVHGVGEQPTDDQVVDTSSTSGGPTGTVVEVVVVVVVVVVVLVVDVVVVGSVVAVVADVGGAVADVVRRVDESRVVEVSTVGVEVLTGPPDVGVLDVEVPPPVPEPVEPPD